MKRQRRAAQRARDARARDINFLSRRDASRHAYPVLAVHDGDEWRRKLEPSVGDFVFNESADYEVTVTTNQGVEVFTSGTENRPKNREDRSNVYRLCFARLRDPRRSRFAQRTQKWKASTSDRSISRSMNESANVRWSSRQTRCAYSLHCLDHCRSRRSASPKLHSSRDSEAVNSPGSTSSPALTLSTSILPPCAICRKSFASKDRRSRKVSNGPSPISSRINGGAAVGNDPAREPLLDEALSAWSSLLYYKTLTARKKRVLF